MSVRKHGFFLFSFLLKKLQQARVIEDSLGFDVGIYCGGSNQLKYHQDWEKEIEQYEVISQLIDMNIYIFLSLRILYFLIGWTSVSINPYPHILLFV